MAFFEQIGKKISDASQGVATQTKNFAETTRLSGAISDNEKKIGRLYADLGKAYYDAHAHDAEAEQRQIIEEINALFADIEAKKEEIKQIKGVTKCPNCGADIPLNAVFCSSCGHKADEVPVGKTCTNCGAEIPAGDRFCSACGTPVEDAQ